VASFVPSAGKILAGNDLADLRHADAGSCARFFCDLAGVAVDGPGGGGCLR
jgi:hypothetical protein